MRRLAFLLLLALGLQAQTLINPSQIRFVAHFASPPQAPTLYTPYLFVDASASGVCSGGGSAAAWCMWNGSTYVAVGAAFTGMGDPGSNSIPYRNGPGTTVPAIAADFPTLNQATTGNAATATALASAPSVCTTGQAPQGILANGNATGCAAIQPSFGSQTANFFFAAPNGSPGSPSFRAIVGADIPTLNQSTTGTAGNITGILARANGGLNSASPGTGFLRDGSTPTAGELSGDCTTTAGFVVTCTSVAHITDGVLAIANGGTGLSTTSQNYVFAGPGSGGGAPAFRLLVAGDLPALSYVQLAGDLGNTTSVPQVIATHLTVPLPRSQGGLNSSSPGTGIMRDGSTPGAAELTGDVTTSGSNAVTLATVNGSPGTCGDATHVCQTTTDGKGRTTAQTPVLIVSGAGILNPAAQYDTPYYSATGTTNTISGTPINGVVVASTSGPPAAASGHNISAVFVCPDAGGSTLLKVCTTATSFAPQLGDMIIYVSASTNVAGMQLSVNGHNTFVFGPGEAFLPPGALQQNVPYLMAFDGTYWTLQTDPGDYTQMLFYSVGPVTDPQFLDLYALNSAGGAGAITFKLPNPPGNIFKRCYRNFAGGTGAITVQVTGTGNTIDLAGVLSTPTTGYVISTGALGDEICLIGSASANNWYATAMEGSWSVH